MPSYTTTPQGTIVLALTLTEARGLHRLADQGARTLLTDQLELALLGSEQAAYGAYTATERLGVAVAEVEARRRERAA